MKKVSVKSLLAALVIAAFAGLIVSDAHAEGPTKGGGVNYRQHKQAHRIGHGVKNGELTRKETAKIVRKEAKLNRKEQRYRADGELSNKEWVKLQHGQNRLSRQIYRQKHDNQDR